MPLQEQAGRQRTQDEVLDRGLDEAPPVQRHQRTSSASAVPGQRIDPGTRLPPRTRAASCPVSRTAAKIELADEQAAVAQVAAPVEEDEGPSSAFEHLQHGGDAVADELPLNAVTPCSCGAPQQTSTAVTASAASEPVRNVALRREQVDQEDRAGRAEQERLGRRDCPRSAAGLRLDHHPDSLLPSPGSGLHDLLVGWLHQIGERFRVDAEREHGDREMSTIRSRASGSFIFATLSCLTSPNTTRPANTACTPHR